MLATDNVCLPFFSCFETPKEPTKCGMVGMLKIFFLIFSTPFLRFFVKIAHIVGWEQERPISARRVRTSYLGSARKNVPSQVDA